MMIKAYGAQAGDLPLEPLAITRRAPGAQDVQIDIAYCGICHSDIHQVRSEWADIHSRTSTRSKGLAAAVSATSAASAVPPGAVSSRTEPYRV